MITEDFIKPYLKNPEKVHDKYGAALEILQELEVHTDGTFPEKELDTARPHEEEIHKKYRKEVWVPVTKQGADEVLKQSKKIPRANGWGVIFPKEQSRLIKDGFGLRQYIENDFPKWDSLNKFVFGFLLKQNFKDPNGVIAVLNREHFNNEPINASGYLSPYPYYFGCTEVIDFKEDEYCVIKSKDPVKYGDNKEGKKFIFIDRDSLVISIQIADDGYQSILYPHTAGFLPVWQLGSDSIKEHTEQYNLYDSFLTAAVPAWKEAIRRYSDHQVNMIMHLHPEKWIRANVDCTAKNCNEGIVNTVDNENRPCKVKCTTCNGTGKRIVTSPANVMIVPTTQARVQEQETTIQGDPIGYAKKPLDALDFLKEEWKDKFKDGFAALGLKMLYENLLNVSGKKTELDRQEINTFFFDLASHITHKHIFNIVYFVNELRYSFVPEKERRQYFTEIKFNVPNSFDVVNEDYFRERYVAAKQNNESPILVQQSGLDYARKAFGEDSQQYKLLSDSYNLDPLPGLSEAEKNELTASDPNNIDVIISRQIEFFLKRAYAENEKFYDLKFEQKLDKLTEYAQVSLTRKNKALINVPIPSEL
jgi:hypothetical protein